MRNNLDIRITSGSLMRFALPTILSSIFMNIYSILALFRTHIFLLVPLLVLPPIFGIWGVWAAPAVAEVLSVLMSVYYFARKKTVYRYA